MSDRNRTENNGNENSKEQKLFRAMSGVDEDLLIRSEQSGKKNTGKVHKFPMRYATRIAAACLCFVVAGVLYVTMSSTKMADSTGSADTAAPQLAYSVPGDKEPQEENEAAAAARAEEAGNDAGMDNDIMSGAAMSEDAAELPEGAMPEGTVTEAASGQPEGALEAAKQNSTITEEASELPESAMAEAADSGMPEAQQDSMTQEKQDSQMSATGADSCCDGGMAESSTEASDDEMQEKEVMEKQGRRLPGKMTRKGL